MGRPRKRADRSAAPSHTTPTHEHASRDQVDDLLGEIRRVRLTLSSDLSAAAGAVDAHELSVARQIINADQGELAGLQARAITAAVPTCDASPPTRTDHHRRRMLLALPAVPVIGALAMTAAAAFNAGSSHGHQAPSHAPRHLTSVTSQRTAMDVAASARTLRQLEHSINQHPQATSWIALANQLHRQLSNLIATSPSQPGHLTEVQHLLSVEQRLLETHQVPGSLQVLAEGKNLLQMLQRANSDTPSSRPTPTTTSSRRTHPFVVHSRRPTPRDTVTTTPPSSPSPQPSTSSSSPKNPLPPPTSLPGSVF